LAVWEGTVIDNTKPIPFIDNQEKLINAQVNYINPAKKYSQFIP